MKIKMKIHETYLQEKNACICCYAVILYTVCALLSGCDNLRQKRMPKVKKKKGFAFYEITL